MRLRTMYALVILAAGGASAPAQLSAEQAGAKGAGVGALPTRAPKLEGLQKPYKDDARILIVRVSGPSTDERCPGVSLGPMSILTAAKCLSGWWENRTAYQVRFSTDTGKRERFSGEFRNVVRPGVAAMAALLETDGHSTAAHVSHAMFEPEGSYREREYDLIGLSPGLKRGKELAMQRRCHLVPRAGDYLYSECGAAFQGAEFLIFWPGSDGTARIFFGLGRVVASQEVRGVQLQRIELASYDGYGTALQQARVLEEKFMAQHRARLLAEARSERAARADSRPKTDWIQIIQGAADAAVIAAGGTPPARIGDVPKPTDSSTGRARPAEESCGYSDIDVSISGPAVVASNGSSATVSSAGGGVFITIAARYPQCRFRFSISASSYERRDDPNVYVGNKDTIIKGRGSISITVGRNSSQYPRRIMINQYHHPDRGGYGIASFGPAIELEQQGMR